MPERIPEAAWLRTVIEAAKWSGWHVAHFRPAPTRSGGYATPMQGDIGFPDLVLARAGAVLLVELKTDDGRATPQQRAWLAAAGRHGRLWRPRDKERAFGELSRLSAEDSREIAADVRHERTQDAADRGGQP